MPEARLRLVPDAATEHQYEAMKVLAECSLEAVGKLDCNLIYATGVQASPTPPDGLYRAVGGKVERVEMDVVGALERVILAHDGRSWSARTLAKIVAALKAPPGAS